MSNTYNLQLSWHLKIDYEIYTIGYPNNDSELVIFDVSWIGDF